MVIRFVFLSMLFFVLFTVQVAAQETEWKTIETEINSFEVPSDWINSFYEEPGTEYDKQIKRGAHFWYLQWRKKHPMDDTFTWYHFQEVDITVMSKLDGKKVSWEEMRKLRGTPERPLTKRLFKTENEICYKCVYDEKDMRGEMLNWTYIIYYKEINNQVHRIEVKTPTRNLKKIKGLEDDFMRIIKSLKVKENDMKH